MKFAFTKPPLDGSLSLLDIISSHGAHSFAHPLFKYVDTADRIRTIVWGEAIKAFNIATQYTMKGTMGSGPPEGRESSVPLPPPVVGILANLDSITYYTLVIGIMNAGFTPFPISPRNSPESVAHLLASTGCETVFVSDDLPIQRLTESSFALYRQCNPQRSPIISLYTPSFEDLYSKNGGSDEQSLISLRKIVDRDTPCVIIHSSGTTSFPKPIEITYRMFFEHALLIGLEGDVCGNIISIHATPMFHLMGLRSISYSAVLGITLSVFRPSKPPTFASPDAVLNSCVATSVSRISCPPAFVESWATERSDVEKLKQFDWIMFGGGPLQSRTGDMMTEEGVNLMPTLGLTEVGPITSYFPKRDRAEEWNWFNFSPFLDLEFVKEEGHTNDVYRMIVKKNAFKTPAVLNTDICGVPAYDTKDLYIRHPTNPELWRIIGRSDDQIMHSTGEKTNPIPIEAELLRCPDISNALMFGRAKFQAGVLIFPAPHHVFDNEEFKSKKAYIELIWPAIVNANNSSPQHSRIFKETILIASSVKNCEYTNKGTVRRAVTLDKYEAEIEELYRSIEVVTQTSAVLNVGTSRTPGFEEVRDLVKDSVLVVLDKSLHDEDDIFQAGVDSLCALSIRNSIVQRLRSSALMDEESIRMLPRDFLYVLSSISKLSAFIYGVIHFDRMKGEMYSKARKEIKNGTSQVQTADEKWQTIMESKQTLVKIVEGIPGIPLIVLHGAPGTLETFPPFQRCTSSIWAIQVTDEAPHDSIEALAQFYYHKIKASQPVGPYRLASYSGSCVILLELVIIFQRNNDQVVQFDMLDHFPTYYFPELNPDLVQLDNPEWFKAHIKQSLKAVMGLISNTEGELSATAALRNKELEDAFNGGPMQPATNQLIQRVSQLIRMSLSYLLHDRFMEGADLGDGTQRKRWSPALFRSFVSDIRPRLAVYIAKQGIRVKTPTTLMDERGNDLGAKLFFPDAHVLHFEGGHLDFLGDNDLLRSIQNNFSMTIEA